MPTCRDIKPRGEMRDHLYAKEKEIVRLLTTTGAPAKEIAAQLGITKGTLKQYITSIMDVLCLETRTRAGLTAMARERGFRL